MTFDWRLHPHCLVPPLPVQGQLIYEAETSAFTYTGSSKKLAKGVSAKDKVLTFIKENKGATASVIDDSMSR